MLTTLLAMLALLALSGFFSGSETALFSLRREHLRALGPRRARFVRLLLKDPKSLLITILFGNLLVNVLFYSTSVVLVLRLNESRGGAWATAAAVAAPILVIVFGEVAPKALAVCRPRPIAELVAPPLVLLRTAVFPVRLVLGVFTEAVLRLLAGPGSTAPFVTAEELKELLQRSQVRGTLRPEEGRMLREMIDLGRLRCREVMVPRVDVVMCPAGETPERFIDLVRRTGRKRIPVYQESEDRILGVVDARHVLAFRPASIADCIRPVAFVPESKSVESLLQEFRQNHTAMAVVVDEYGGTAGLVTLHDILEELVGDIGALHEGPEAEPVRRIGPDTYLVSGRLGIRDWNEHPAFSVELARRGTDTLGGFVVSLLGRMPRPGDVVAYRNLRFTVESVLRRRIEQLRVEVLPPEGTEAAGIEPATSPEAEGGVR